MKKDTINMFLLSLIVRESVSNHRERPATNNKKGSKLI